MRRRELRASVTGGHLVGWVAGAGPRVLLLHGGPGMSFTYLDDLADEIGAGYEIASYQQRGLAPSTAMAPYDVDTQVGDVAAVLDALGWDKAFVVGHSWGGHLALHVAVSLTDRLQGVLCLDPLGGVGDGGEAAFDAAKFNRTPEEVRQKAKELDDRAVAGEESLDVSIEGLRLLWPSYYADPASAPPMPPMSLSLDASAFTWASLREKLPALEAALPGITVPVGFVAGAGSPMPLTASTDSADQIPGAWVDVVPAAGHFPWHERPGCVRKALQQLDG